MTERTTTWGNEPTTKPKKTLKSKLMNGIAWLLSSKSAKMGAGAIGGSSLLAIVFGLHTDVTHKIEKERVAQKEYVELVLEPIKTEIKHLSGDSRETKQLVRDIHNHLLKNSQRR